MNSQEMIDAIQSFKQNGIVLVSGIGDNAWFEEVNPSWDFSRFNYKPYIKPIELYANIYVKNANGRNVEYDEQKIKMIVPGRIDVSTHKLLINAVDNLTGGGRTFKLTEIINQEG